MYHDPKPEIFAKQLQYLSKHYHFISLDALVDAIHTKDESKIPPKSLVVTIDDGYLGNYKLLSLFKAHQIRPTIYLCTQIVNTDRHFWFKANHLNEHKHKKYREFLKGLDTKKRIARLRKDFNYEPQEQYSNRQALNLHELVEMGYYVDFQPHTQFHPILPACTREVCEKEIGGSKRDLETLLNGTCTHFSYPNGNYTEREINIIKRCGYQSARSLDRGWNHINSDPYRLKVINLTDDASVNQLIAQMSGVAEFLKYYLNLPPYNFKKHIWQADREKAESTRDRLRGG